MTGNHARFAVLVLFFATLGYVAYHYGDFDRLRAIHPGLLALLFLIAAGYYVTQVFLLQLVLAKYGLRLPWIESARVFFFSLFANIFFPAAGMVLRGKYLKDRHGFPWKAFFSGLLLLSVIEVQFFAILGLCSMIPIFQSQDPTQFAVVSLLGSIAAFGVLALLPIRLPHALTVRLPARFVELLDCLYSARDDWPFVARVAFWTTVQIACFCLLFATTYTILQASIPATGILLTATLADLSFFFRLAPASAGSFEAALLLTSSIYGQPFGITILAISLSRLALLSLTLIFGFASGYTLIRSLNR